MPEPFPRDFKILTIKLKLPKHNLYKTIIRCSTKEKFEDLLNKYESSTLIIACTNKTLIEMASILKTCSNIKQIFVLTEHREILWPIDLEESRSNFEWTSVENRNQLMRRLLTCAMYFYVQQGDQHKILGNHGLANLCFRDAIDALNQSARL